MSLQQRDDHLDVSSAPLTRCQGRRGDKVAPEGRKCCSILTHDGTGSVTEVGLCCQINSRGYSIFHYAGFAWFCTCLLDDSSRPVPSTCTFLHGRMRRRRRVGPSGWSEMPWPLFHSTSQTVPYWRPPHECSSSASVSGSESPRARVNVKAFNIKIGVLEHSF